MPKNRITRSMIRELCTITTRTESGEHFTSAYRHWQALEDAGLIEVHRPVHATTGLPYGQDEWTLQVTEAGVDLVDQNPELHPN